MSRLLLAIHLSCALSATVAYWTTGFSPKGGRLHRAAGRWFARLVYATAVTGGTLATVGLLTPGLPAAHHTMWFVFYVLVIIVTPVQHALAVVRAASSPARVRSRVHAALNSAALLGTLAILAAGVAWQEWLWLIVMPIGFIVGLRDMSYASRRSASRIEWEREHLTSTIAAGITLHTAFFVFATSRSLGWQLSGIAQVVPWVLPAAVGVPLIVWLRATRST